MVDEATIRATVAGEEVGLAALYRAAFPDENLLPLVERLLAEEPGVLSLAAMMDGEPIGHVLFTPCGVGDQKCRAALLGPLAVAPSKQRRGIGKSLVREGFNRLGQTALAQVVVLGDPAYYRQLGFQAEKSILPACEIPKEWTEAWQSVRLDPGMETLAGTLRPPAAWLSPSLWGT